MSTMIPPTRMERAYGSPPMWGGAYEAAMMSHARRMAGEDRARAYRAMDPLGYWLPSPDLPHAAWDERRYGMPVAFAPIDDGHDCNLHR